TSGFWMMATSVLWNPYATAKPAARKPSERRMRLRSSSRCSIRLMPGSSARSERAARARSMGSISGMEGLGFDRSLVGRAGGLGREVFGERELRGGCDGQAGGWRQNAQLAGGCDGEWGCGRLRLSRGIGSCFVGRFGQGIVCGIVRGIGSRIERILGRGFVRGIE